MRAIQEALGHIEQKPKEQKEKQDKKRDTEEEKESFSQTWVMTNKSKDPWASLTAQLCLQRDKALETLERWAPEEYLPPSCPPGLHPYATALPVNVSPTPQNLATHLPYSIKDLMSFQDAVREHGPHGHLAMSMFDSFCQNLNCPEDFKIWHVAHCPQGNFLNGGLYLLTSVTNKLSETREQMYPLLVICS
jgi:hypothetical protein